MLHLIDIYSLWWSPLPQKKDKWIWVSKQATPIFYQHTGWHTKYKSNDLKTPAEFKELPKTEIRTEWDDTTKFTQL